jgi:hypothetical protein
VHELQSWMEEMKRIACSFPQPSLLEYLHMRETGLKEKYSSGLAELQAIHRLLSQIHEQ